MTKEQKNQEITELVDALKNTEIFYLSDTSSLNAEATSSLRRECFKAGIQMRVVKNTLLKKAMERIEGKDYSPLYPALHGNTAVMIAEVGNVPARLIKDFKKKYDKPAFKAAFIQEDCYVGLNNSKYWLLSRAKTNCLEISSVCCNHLPKTLSLRLRAMQAIRWPVSLKLSRKERANQQLIIKTTF